MLIAPKPLSSVVFSREELKLDRKPAVKYGPCALGKRALYVGAWGFLSCFWYVPLVRVRRVFKRLAVSKGFYEQGKVYGSIAYLVVQFDKEGERVCRFDHEEELDLLLGAIRKNTKIPVGKP